MTYEESRFLVWFYHHVDPAIQESLKASYEDRTGLSVPEIFGVPEWKPTPITVRTPDLVIDFTKENTRQLHRDLCEVYNTEARLVALLRRLGISPADIPFMDTLNHTWMEVLINIHNRMKVGELLTLIGDGAS